MKIMDSVDDGQDDDRVNLFCICYNLELFRTLVRGATGAFGKRRISQLFLSAKPIIAVALSLRQCSF